MIQYIPEIIPKRDEKSGSVGAIKLYTGIQDNIACTLCDKIIKMPS
jgi:hypothetical protein